MPTFSPARHGSHAKTKEELRQKRRQLQEQNKLWPAEMSPVSEEKWSLLQPISENRILAVWRSKTFCAYLYQEPGDVPRRLTINRTALGPDGRWKDGITWDEIQRVKRECGFGDFEAVEIYPRDTDIIDVANMRHIWILHEPMPFSWSKKGPLTREQSSAKD